MNDAAPRSNSTSLDDLMEGAQGESSAFSVGFRGYDKHEVDAAIADLTARAQKSEASLGTIEKSHRDELEKVRAEKRELQERLEAENTAARAQVADAEKRVSALSAEYVEGADGKNDPPSRAQFEAVLKVAEEQASLLLQNASVQAERLLEAARAEVANQRKESEANSARVLAQAQQDAGQVRLRIDTEYTAHQARTEREAARSAEITAQAEQEAATIRTEAEKGAAALRAMVTRETLELRAEAERDVREMNARVLEFDESLTRRQDDAQQEFLVLHNQAVAHADRITTDANERVAAALEHAKRISAKAEDHERLMRAQAQQIEAEAQVRSREILERSRTKAQKIVDSVSGHTTGVLRDAEDRTRQLRWQQQQLTSFMSEVRELMRPEGLEDLPGESADPASEATTTSETATGDAPDAADNTDDNTDEPEETVEVTETHDVHTAGDDDDLDDAAEPELTKQS